MKSTGHFTFVPKWLIPGAPVKICIQSVSTTNIKWLKKQIFPGGHSYCRSDRYARPKFFQENPKKYPDFDFKPLKNTRIAILRVVLGKIAYIFQTFSKRP